MPVRSAFLYKDYLATPTRAASMYLKTKDVYIHIYLFAINVNFLSYVFSGAFETIEILRLRKDT